MKKLTTTAGRIAMLTLLAGMFSACTTVTQEQLAAVDAKADRALAAAQAAQSTANSATTDARRAQDAANEALACCRANTERFDRMMRDAVTK